MSHPTSVLTIAGSDPSGGAGIQADLKTIAAMQCYGTSAITALTAQNTVGVQGVHPCPPEFVGQQITSVLDDIEIHAIKTGMLYDADIIKAAMNALKKHYGSSDFPPLVCDPVCVSTSGHSLLHPTAIQALTEELFPLATLITPNKSEAELLLSFRNLPSKIDTVDDMLRGATDLLCFGSRAVLLKGGHITVTEDEVHNLKKKHPGLHVIKYGLMEENMEILQVGGRELITSDLVVDVLQRAHGKTTIYVRPRIESRSTHGTGCTLSAAIASVLARGADMEEAISDGTAFTHLGIETATSLGRGHGPLNHHHSVTLLSVPKRTPSNPYPFTRLLIQGTARIWKEYVQHDFVKLLGKGTLPLKPFLHFIKQDYHYLKYYARAYGLLAAKSPEFSSIKSSAQTILYILHEIATHKSYCLTFGISEQELESEPESSATMAYGGYLLDMGLQGDATKLLVALLACLLGYGEVGLWLKKESEQPNTWVMSENNPYKKWMDDYSGRDYQNAVSLGLEVIESRAENDAPSPARLAEWRGVWENCTLLEKRFWDSAMAAEWDEIRR